MSEFECKCWWGKEGNQDCPVMPIHDKLEEAHWFYHAMIRDYHSPFLFRYQLSAFLTSLKSFFEFIPAQANSLNDEVMKEFFRKEKEKLNQSGSVVIDLFNIRNTSVHRGSLKKNTRITIGRYKPNKGFKQAMDMEVDPFTSSEDLLSRYIESMKEMEMLKPDTDSGEILAIERVWKLAENNLDEKEISEYCAEGLEYMIGVNKRLHDLYKVSLIVPEDCEHHINEVKIIEYHPDLLDDN